MNDTFTSSINRLPSRRSRLLVAAATALAFVLTASAPVAAVNANNTGRVEHGWGACMSNSYILVHTPIIDAAPVQYATSGVVRVGHDENPPQQVAFRAHLAQWTGSGWMTIQNGPWWVTTTGPAHWLGHGEWYTLTGERMSRAIGFDQLAVGTLRNPIYYAVWYEYYWYQDSYRSSGYSSSWAVGYQENRGNAIGTAVIGQAANGWCKSPGPNFINY